MSIRSCLTVAAALALSLASGVARAHGPTTIDMPVNGNGYQCGGRVNVLAGGYSNPAHDPIADALAAVAVRRKTGGDLLWLVGADWRALWVLEVYNGTDACDSCLTVKLREIGYAGERREHELMPTGEELRDFDKLVAERLRSWGAYRKLRPAMIQANVQPIAAGPVSDWALRIHDPIHRKTYAWRQHLHSFMCFCPYTWELSTHLW